MDIHRYNKRTGYIDKTINITPDNAVMEFKQIVREINLDPFCEYYRVTLVDSMRNSIIRDSDSPFI